MKKKLLEILNYLKEFIFDYSRFIIRKKLIQEVLVLKNNKLDILDVGAGDSRYKYIFKEHNYKSQDIGLDKNFKFDTIDFKCDISNLAKRKIKFDFILCTQVLEHVFDYEKFLKDLANLTNKGGHIFLTTNFYYFEHAIPNDYFRFSRYALQKIIKDKFNKELEILKCSPLDGFFTSRLDFLIGLPFHIFGDKSIIAKILVLLVSPIILLIRILCILLDKLDNKKKVYSVIGLYLIKK